MSTWTPSPPPAASRCLCPGIERRLGFVYHEESSKQEQYAVRQHCSLCMYTVTHSQGSCLALQAGLQGIELVNITSQYGLHYRVGTPRWSCWLYTQ